LHRGRESSRVGCPSYPPSLSSVGALHDDWVAEPVRGRRDLGEVEVLALRGHLRHTGRGEKLSRGRLVVGGELPGDRILAVRGPRQQPVRVDGGWKAEQQNRSEALHHDRTALIECGRLTVGGDLDADRWQVDDPGGDAESLRGVEQRNRYLALHRVSGHA